ncbi:unnamed protein product [Rotaria sp. Silwood2]|nr:unnamed protein product [Rotaria sp. Silwood2]CAF2675434.1 unnamed protein product [Rotaria sp. Silwood2]CAF3083426.1 unnamed protein product [Rotaria sp. Silwood2]
MTTEHIDDSAWISDKDSPVVARLSQLISALTNLTMETTEDLQVANYGVGGHYSPHFDFYHVTIQFIRRSCQIFCFRSGNRIATWLTYLSDVELGGATVFPMVDGYIVPKKGSAAFWYNLYASGEGMIFLRFIALN